MTVFLRASHNTHNSLFNHEVVIWWSNVDVSMVDRLTVSRMERAQRSGPVEDVGQHTGALGGDMQDEKDSCRQVRGQRTCQRYKSFYPASRCSNHDHIMSGHGSTLSLIVA